MFGSSSFCSSSFGAVSLRKPFGNSYSTPALAFPSTMSSVLDGRPIGYRIAHQSVPTYGFRARRIAVQSETAQPTVTPGPAAYERGGYELAARATMSCEPSYSMAQRFGQLHAVQDADFRSSWASLSERTPGPGEHQRLAGSRGRGPAFSLGSRRKPVPSELGKPLPMVTPGPAAYAGIETGARATKLRSEPGFSMGRRFRSSMGAVPDPGHRNSWNSHLETTPGPGAYDLTKY